MRQHQLQPPPGSKKDRKRVGRGDGSQGTTSGKGTKGQKARAGGSIPPWFEGGQTPIHVRIPKLRGFKNRFKVEYEVVNIGRIAQYVELGAFEAGEVAAPAGKAAKAAPITVNQEILRAVGLVSTLDKPLKVLGQGEVSVPLFVVADAFSKSAVAKIEAGITKNAFQRIGANYPTTVENAKFSMPYIGAWTTLYGPPVLKTFTERALEDEKVKALSKPAASTTSSVCSKSASVSPGKPTMMSVPIARSGIAARSRSTSSR